jgi:hypothetical protein
MLIIGVWAGATRGRSVLIDFFSSTVDSGLVIERGLR